MADLSAILQQAMADPQIMSQVASLAQSLGMQGGQQPSSPPQTQAEAPASIPAEAPTMAAPAAAFPQFHMPGAGSMPQMDPRQLMGSLLKLSQNIGGDERQLALIRALKPFVRPERARKLERAIQIARMSRLAEQALGGLSGNFGQAGDHHV